VKADKNYRADIHENVSIHVPKTSCHLFDAESGVRIGG